MAPTSGFTLAALPKSPSVPAKIGSIDTREMYDTVRAALLAAEQTRSATGKAILADEQIRTGVAEARAQQDVLPTLTQATVTDTPLRSRLLANQVENAELTAPMNRQLLATQVGNAEALAPFTQRTAAANTQTAEAKAKIADAESTPEFIEARMKRMLAQLTPTGVREFDLLTRDLTPAEKEKALRIHLGLTGRASGAAIQYKEVVGPDGIKRLVAVDPREVGAHVVGSGETYGSGVGSPSATPAGTAEPTIDGATKPTENVFKSRPEEESKGLETAAAKTQEIVLENRAKLPKARSSVDALEGKTSHVEGLIKQAAELAGPMTTGYGSLLGNLPATDARKLRGIIDAIKANVGFDALTEMRQNSPTGGALGNVSDFEGRLLQSTIATLDQAQSWEDVIQALDTIQRVRGEVLKRVRYAYERDVEAYGEKKGAAPSAGGDGESQVGRFKIIEVK